MSLKNKSSQPDPNGVQNWKDSLEKMFLEYHKSNDEYPNLLIADHASAEFINAYNLLSHLNKYDARIEIIPIERRGKSHQEFHRREGKSYIFVSDTLEIGGIND